jgi:hypothetical protein
MRFLITTHADPKHMPTTFIDPDEIVAGPQYNKVKHGDRLRFIGIPSGRSDFHRLWDLIPQAQKPDVLLVHADATSGCLPVNLPEGISKFLLVGDTHHLSSPISAMLNYALTNNFTAIFVWNRQHAHFFKEAGFPYVFWMPGLIMGIPEVRHFEGPRVKTLAFFGQAGKYHPRRIRLLDAIRAHGLPMVSGIMPRLDGLEIFGRTLIAFNASLNAEFNMRIFEASSQGAMLLTDRLAPQAGLEEFYKEGESLVTYADEKELLDKAAYYLSHPEVAVEIGRKGREVYDRHFTTAARRETFIDIVTGRKAAPCHFLADEPRYSVDPAKTPAERDALVRRIQIYEWMQELHRQLESVSVDIVSLGSPLLVSDLSDLARLDLRLKGPLVANAESIGQMFGVLGAKVRCDASPCSGATLLLADTASLASGETAKAVADGKYRAVYVADANEENRTRVAEALSRLGMKTNDSAGRMFFRDPAGEPFCK